MVCPVFRNAVYLITLSGLKHSYRRGFSEQRTVVARESSPKGTSIRDYARMVESVDTADLKFAGSNLIRVRVSIRALTCFE